MKAFHRAAEHYQAGKLEAFYETLTVASFRNARISVSLADPSQPDCPLVGVSQGFEQMTGYSRSEVVGRNCRFLNRGCPMPASVRHELRQAIHLRRKFVNVLVNRRKNGEVFKNLLHMTALRVGSTTYLLGIQADVTNSDVELSLKEHLEELNRIVDAIFATNVDAWAAIQLASYNATKLNVFAPYAETQLIPRKGAWEVAEAKSAFVALASDDSPEGQRLRYSNTFIEICNEDNSRQAWSTLRRVYSEPVLGSAGDAPPSGPTEPARVPDSALRDFLCQVQVTEAPSAALLRVEAGGSKTDGASNADGDGGDGARGGRSRTQPAADVRPRPQYEGGDNRSVLADGCESIEASAVDNIIDGDDESQAGMPLKSVGSATHPYGCKACSFFCYSQKGCNRGSECVYCHMDHPKRSRRRGKKKWKDSSLNFTSSNCPGDLTMDEEEKAVVVLQKSDVLPAPTPPTLVPLLTALEMLSPLPAVLTLQSSETCSAAARTPSEADSCCRQPWLTNGSNSSRHQGEHPGGNPVASSSDWEPEEFEFSYSESRIVLATGQWKQVIPFVSGQAAAGDACFSVSPTLPRGLQLHRRSGVISGVAEQSTGPSDTIHTVLCQNRKGSAATALTVRVLRSVQA